MILEREKITGVVLAGGRGRRMGGEDKGLLLFEGRCLASYALDILRPVAGYVLISANRNHEQYSRLGCPVISDRTDTFEGPLAGLLSAMRVAKTPYVLALPCDSPEVGAQLPERLGQALAREGAELCAAYDGERLQPLFLLAERRLADSLESFLAEGERKVETWLRRHKLTVVDCGDHPEWFANINTPAELAAPRS